MALLLAVFLTGCAASDASGGGSRGSGGDAAGRASRTVEVAIRYSRFLPDAIEVPAGSTVTFVVRNDDPIAHEFILGTAAEQAAHERGTEVTHAGAPGAASLEPGETVEVAFTFDGPGTVEFACHLPGHYAYGMRGTVTAR